MTSLPVFACTVLSARLSVEKCAANYEQASGLTPSARGLVGAQGGPKASAHALYLSSSRCKDCALGAAHARGETPAAWPSGAPVVRTELVAHASVPSTPPVSRPRVAATKEIDMPAGKHNRYDYKGRSLLLGELVELPEAKAARLDGNTIRLRIGNGWTVERAVSTPKGASRTPAAKPAAIVPRRERAAKAEIVPARDAARATAPMLDPVTLLERLGVDHELVGRTPRGRLVLLVEASESA